MHQDQAECSFVSGYTDNDQLEEENKQLEEENKQLKEKNDHLKRVQHIFVTDCVEAKNKQADLEEEKS